MKYDRETLVNKIAEHEGVVLEPYRDSLGINTIGIGRNLEGRGIADYELMHMNKTLEEILDTGLTKKEAYYLCNNDIDIVEKELVKQKPIVVELNEARQMCLVDMGFNLGIPRLMKFKKMWEAIERQDFEWAAAEMLNSRWAKQVGRRADNLAKVMENGDWVD